MSSERVYRWLLVLYPREHRREYGELMVQLFLDRMRCESNGFRGFIFWMQMIFDLAGAAFNERRADVRNTRRMWVGAALGLVVVAGVAGVSTFLSQPKIEVKVFSLEADALSTTESDAVNEVMRQAVEESTISQNMADKIVRSFEGVDPSDVHGYKGHGIGVAGALGQAVEEGIVPYEVAEETVRAVDKRLGEFTVPLSVVVLARKETGDSQ